MLTTEALESLSVEQMLAKSKLQAEQRLMKGDVADVNTLTSNGKTT